MKNNIKQVNEKDKILIEEINSFISNSKYSDYRQTIEWKNARCENNKYALYRKENNKIIWFAVLLEKKNRENQSYLYIPRGPVLDYSNLENLHQFLIDIKSFLLQKKIKMLVINPKIKKINIEKLKDKNYMIKKKEKYDFDNLLESTREALLKVYDEEEKLLLKLDSKTRYNIRRVQKKGLTKSITENFDLSDFMVLYKQTAERHNFNMHNEKYFRNILNIYGTKIVCCTIKLNNTPLAMSINIKHKDTLEYVYGVSSNEHRDLMPCYLLHWSMIKYAKENQFQYYNFGGVHCTDGDKTNKDYGLMIFKSKFCIDGFEEYEPDLEIIFNDRREK